MPLYPPAFIDDLRLRADLVRVVQDVVPLKKAGATYKGLCPFHSEKTPSFHVNPEKGFFHCFGCQTGGDVFKFVELHERVSFPEAVRLVAQRFGVPLPEPAADDRRGHVDNAEREALLTVHEVAADWFARQLAAPAGTRARQQLADRGMSEATIARLRLGYAPNSRDALKLHLAGAGFPLALIVRSGLVVERESGETVDRFRGRLMIPICRDSGSVVAFGGRSLEPDQQPKYLNSPETPIYTKSRTLYGLHLSKAEIRRLNYAILVEGYFDVAALVQAGVTPVVASCGTALTTQQAQTLRRFTRKILLSFDPDTAGQSAAVRSCELLVSEGFDVNVALLPPGEDPDTFVRRRGRDAYIGLLRTSAPYLDFLIDRTAGRHDLGTDDGRRSFLHELLGAAARIPDAATRDQFADRLALRARITEDVVRAEIRKAASARRTTLSPGELPPTDELKPAERGLLWGLVHDPAAALAALEDLDDGDLALMASRRLLELARALADRPPEAVPAALLERLTEEEARLVTALAAEPGGPAPPDECVRALKRVRYDHERAALQREIDRLQDDGSPQTAERIAELGQKKIDLKRRIEALSGFEGMAS